MQIEVNCYLSEILHHSGMNQLKSMKEHLCRVKSFCFTQTRISFFFCSTFESHVIHYSKACYKNYRKTRQIVQHVEHKNLIFKWHLLIAGSFFQNHEERKKAKKPWNVYSKVSGFSSIGILQKQRLYIFFKLKAFFAEQYIKFQ